MDRDRRTYDDLRNRLPVVSTKSESAFTVGFEEHRTDVYVVHDHREYRSGRQIDLTNADLEFETAAVNFKLREAGR